MLHMFNMAMEGLANGIIVGGAIAWAVINVGRKK